MGKIIPTNYLAGGAGECTIYFAGQDVFGHPAFSVLLTVINTMRVIAIARHYPFQKVLLSMVTFVVIILCCYFFWSAPSVHASSLSESQIQSILTLLRAFDVDAATIQNVDAILRGSTSATTSTGSLFSVDAKMAPLVAAFGPRVTELLQGETLPEYLYGSAAQNILHGSDFGPTGDVSKREQDVVPCDTIPKEKLAVIVSAGQSNGSNSISPDVDGKLYQPHTTFYNLNIGDGKCYIGRNPLLGMDVGNQKYAGYGWSYVSTLADHLIDAGLYQNVLVVPISVSGTYIEEWRPEGKHFPRFTKAIAALNNIGLKPTFILWHQGEANAGILKSGNQPDGTKIILDRDLIDAAKLSYMRNFFTMVSALREQGVAAPMFPATVTICGGGTEPAIRDAQSMLPDASWGIYAGPDTDMLGQEWRDDGCHFSYQGGLKHAVLWKEVLESYLKNTDPIPGVSAPKIVLEANGKDFISIGQGEQWTLTWKSADVSSCTISYDTKGGAGSYAVAPNVAGSGTSGGIGIYTLDCLGNDRSKVSKTVKITSAVSTVSTPASPSVSLSANGADSLVISKGENYTVSWNSSNVSSCTMSYTSTAGPGSYSLPPNASGSAQTGLVGSYTFTCTSSDGTQVHKTITITTNASAQSTPSLLAGIFEGISNLLRSQVATVFGALHGAFEK